jgi:hypothetical protein
VYQTKKINSPTGQVLLHFEKIKSEHFILLYVPKSLFRIDNFVCREEGVSIPDCWPAISCFGEESHVHLAESIVEVASINLLTLAGVDINMPDGCLLLRTGLLPFFGILFENYSHITTKSVHFFSLQ